MKPVSYDQAAFDAVLEQNFAGDREIFEATAMSFLESVHANSAELEAAFASGDTDRVMKAAHRLKGETSLFHIAEIPASFKLIEHGARAGQLPTSNEITMAKAALWRLADEIRQILG